MLRTCLTRRLSLLGAMLTSGGADSGRSGKPASSPVDIGCSCLMSTSLIGSPRSTSETMFIRSRTALRMCPPCVCHAPSDAAFELLDCVGRWWDCIYFYFVTNEVISHYGTRIVAPNGMCCNEKQCNQSPLLTRQ